MNEIWCSNTTECRILNRSKLACKKTCGYFYNPDLIPTKFNFKDMPMIKLNCDIETYDQKLKIEFAYLNADQKTAICLNNRLIQSFKENKPIKNFIIEF